LTELKEKVYTPGRLLKKVCITLGVLLSQTKNPTKRNEKKMLKQYRNDVGGNLDLRAPLHFFMFLLRCEESHGTA